MKYTEIPFRAFSKRVIAYATASLHKSREEFSRDLFLEKGTVNKQYRNSISCFSREEFSRDLFLEKGTVK